MVSRGVIYVAYGGAARACLISSVRSLQQTNSGLPVTVITDEQIDGLDCIIREDDHVGARTAKLEVARRSPYKRTCYLDADTTVLAALDAGFNLLDAFDLVLAVDGKYAVQYVAKMTTRVPFARQEVRATVEDIGTSMISLHNCGMIFFRPTEGVKRLFELWREEWERFGQRDQLAFVRALHRNPVRMLTLPHAWNTGYAPKAEVVLHRWGEARRAGAP